jgi:hypothetical protein
MRRFSLIAKARRLDAIILRQVAAAPVLTMLRVRLYCN